ncbi:MAG: nuclear transport factor 2 family protein [Hyphomonadaceae bacterium]|nr:nuclear transport factor 2 family protein [Hyphomonadaceae bacterium]
MSTEENFAVVSRYAAAWVAGDLATLVACYHDDLSLHYGGASSLAGSHRGKAAALRALGEVSRRTQRKLINIVDVMAGPERAVIIAREAFTRTGETVEFERTLVYAIADGLLHECWLLERDQALVDRFLAD